IMGKPASKLQVYDLTKDGEMKSISITGHVQAMALSADGKTLAISFLRTPSVKPKLELWDVATFKVRTTQPSDSRKGFQNYRTLAFSPDGKTLVGAPSFEKVSPEKILDVLDLEG